MSSVLCGTCFPPMESLSFPLSSLNIYEVGIRECALLGGCLASQFPVCKIWEVKCHFKAVLLPGYY